MFPWSIDTGQGHQNIITYEMSARQETEARGNTTRLGPPAEAGPRGPSELQVLHE